MPLMLLQLGVVVLLQNYLIYHTPAASDKSLQRFYWTIWHLLTCIHCSKMAVRNFTKDINQKEIEELLCSSQMNITREVHNQLIFLSVLNTFLSSTAILGNTLILVALRRDFSIGSLSKLLYRSLAITDLCVGVMAEPADIVYWMSVVNSKNNICSYANAVSFFTGYILCSVSLATLTLISVDRLLALLLGLRYRQIVTLKRTYIAINGFWISSIAGTAVFYWYPAAGAWLLYICLPLCLVITASAYTKIFLTLRRNQIQVQSHVSRAIPNQASPLNIARYRRAVTSALWIQFTLVVCYLPYGLAVALTPQTWFSLSFYLARQFTVTLAYLNSSLNPLLYCWKIKEIRQAVKDTITQIFCSSY